MLDNLGGWEFLVLILVALFVIGPERLPKVLASVRDGIRKVRRMATNASNDISKEVGSDIDITDLHPKTFIRKHVLSEEDEQALRKPLQTAVNDVKQHTKPLQDELDDTARSIRSKSDRGNVNESQSSESKGDEPEDSAESASESGESRRYDLDAT